MRVWAYRIGVLLAGLMALLGVYWLSTSKSGTQPNSIEPAHSASLNPQGALDVEPMTPTMTRESAESASASGIDLQSILPTTANAPEPPTTPVASYVAPPFDNKYKARSLRSAITRYESGTAQLKDAYHVMMLSECLIQDSIGIALPPEGSPEWRKRNDIEIGFWGKRYYFPRADNPEFSKVTDLMFGGSANRALAGSGADAPLSEHERRFIADRIARAAQTLGSDYVQEEEEH